MNTEHRKILIINGNYSHSIKQCQRLLNGQPALWLSDQILDGVQQTFFKQAKMQLGQENTVVIFDATCHFDVNALGAIAGTLVGGGLLILLLPIQVAHHQHPNFLKRLHALLIQHKITTDHCQTIFSSHLSEKPPNISPKNSFVPTKDQHQVIKAIINVAKGRRKRPLVLTADRGRGKTSTLGAAASALAQQDIQHIIVCAPAKAMVQPLFQHAEDTSNLYYYAPDELDQKKPVADLVIIDEAGAIPVPLLTRLLQHYTRIVFSSTLMGYEGNGRGFAIRFQDQLNTYTPNWRAINLHSPIRWAANDPLEHLINDLLLLDADTPHIDTIEQPKYQLITRDQLINDEGLLRQLFGLLVIAHYQTRPSDLLQLLDGDNISIHALTANEVILAVAVVSHEGTLDHELTTHIFEGKRRPKGHLVPQILTFQSGIPYAAQLKTDRIMRIAVHSDWQQQSLGTQLLQYIQQDSTADYLSTSFGLSHRLLNFWQQSHYQIAHLGLKREASSGYHSAVFLLPLSHEGTRLLEDASQRFSHNFLALLTDALKAYPADLVLKLLSQCTFSHKSVSHMLQKQDIIRFSQGQCGYDLAMASLYQWLPHTLSQHTHVLSVEEGKLLVMRLLQHHDWQTCCQTLSITGKKVALLHMQQAVAKLLSQCNTPFNIEEH